MTREGSSSAAEHDLEIFREVFAESRGSRRLRVLVVEDDDEDFFLLRRHLEEMDGFDTQVARATNLDAAMDLSEATDFQVALVDYWLGADTGPRVLQGLGGRNGSVPTILVTGLRDETFKRAALKAGAIHCLSKDDVTATVLQDAISSVLHTHAVENEHRADSS